MSHTKDRLTVYPDGSSGGDLHFDSGDYLCNAEPLENAKRLALCWNAHDALVLFCREFLQSTTHRRNSEHLEELARSALKLAE